MSRRAATYLAALFLLAIVLRVGAIAYTHATVAPAEENRLIARNLAAGRGFTFTEFGVTGPTAIRGPAYPMLLAFVGPDHVKLILAINVIAGGFTVLAAFALTRRLTVLSPLPCTHGRGLGRGSAEPPTNSRSADPFPNPLPEYRARGQELRPAFIAAALFAVWPTQVYAATLTQGLSVAVLLTLMALALAFRRTPGATIAAGALAGLAALTEPVLALPLLFAAIAIGWRPRDGRSDGRSAWPQAAVFVAVGCVTVAPWLYRNAIVFGRPMPITSNFWRDAFLGNGDDASGSLRIDDWTTAVSESVRKGSRTRLSVLPTPDYDRLKVPERDRVTIYRDKTLEWLKHNPGRYALLCWFRLVKFAGIDTNRALPGHRLMIVLGGATYVLVRLWMLIQWLSLASLENRGNDRGVVVALGLGLLVMFVFTMSDPRSIVPSDAVLILATAVTGGFIPRYPVKTQ